MKKKIVTIATLDVSDMTYDSEFGAVIGYLEVPRGSQIIDTKTASNICTLYLLHDEDSHVMEKVPCMYITLGDPFSTTPKLDEHLLKLRDILSIAEHDTIINNITPIPEFSHLVTNEQNYYMLFYRSYIFDITDLDKMQHNKAITTLY